MRFSSQSLAASLLVTGQVLATKHEQMQSIAYGASSAVAYGASSAVAYATSSASAAAVTATYAATATVSAAAGHETVHVVQVGGTNGSTIFSPSNVVAKPGDLVQFQFNAKNHSVVQSTFDNPCIPIQNIMPNKTDAFFSGFMPTNHTFGTSGVQLVYTIRVKDTKPIWYYCSQGKHCQAGMVGAINAVSSGKKTVDAFKALAAIAPANLSPGQQPGDLSVSESSVSAGASTVATGTAIATTPATATAAESGVALSTGGIVATATTSGVLQQSVNAAPGRFVDAARNGMAGAGFAGIAAFFVL